MNIPTLLIPEGNLDSLIEEALKESNEYEGLIFAATLADFSEIYVYDISMAEPLKIDIRDKYVRSFCYDPVRKIVYDAGDYRTVLNTVERKVIQIDGKPLLTGSAIFSMVYHQGEIYYAPYSEGIFKLSNKELIATREHQTIQSLFIFENQICDACRGEFMRFTKTGEKIGQLPYEARYVLGYKDTIYHAGEYGIKDVEKKVFKKREGATLTLLPFRNKILDAGAYCSIQDIFTDRIFLPFDRHITAMTSIPLNMVGEFRERYENT